MAELTVCMIVYNGENTLRESVGSVLRQTLKDFVLLVYDDGSTDGTSDVLKSFDDPRIKVNRSEKNLGCMYGRTFLIKQVETEYCMWLDADDYFCRDDALERALEAIKSDDFDLVDFPRVRMIDASGNESIIGDNATDVRYFGDNLFQYHYPYQLQIQHVFRSKIMKSELQRKTLPDTELIYSRQPAEDIFFCSMFYYLAKRYCCLANEEPIYAYRYEIGIWGSRKDDNSPERFKELCEMQNEAFLSLYSRMNAARDMNPQEVLLLVKGTCFRDLCRRVKFVRHTVGDREADLLRGIWHGYFGRDGEHLINSQKHNFVMPFEIKEFELIMTN